MGEESMLHLDLSNSHNTSSLLTITRCIINYNFLPSHNISYSIFLFTDILFSLLTNTDNIFTTLLHTNTDNIFTTLLLTSTENILTTFLLTTTDNILTTFLLTTTDNIFTTLLLTTTDNLFSTLLLSTGALIKIFHDCSQ